uniref:Uncharacterized protein n=1 Tax=Alloyangia mangrovi TaxID=1779329 RepID=A0A2A3K033_9RHOB
MIPAHLAEEVAAEVLELTVYEDTVVDQVEAGEPIIGFTLCWAITKRSMAHSTRCGVGRTCT